jgi:hypothetical protein
MDIVISVLLIVGSMFFAYFLFKQNRRRDQDALDEEIDDDFSEEFGLPESPSGDLSPESMEKVVDWLEDDIRSDQPKPRKQQLNEPEDIV